MNKDNPDILTDKFQIKNYFMDWYPGLVMFAQHFINSQAEAEDIVQNAFIKLFESFNGEKNINAAKAFLYKTIRNECLNLIKHEAVKQKYSHASENNINTETFFLEKIIEEETFSYLSNAIKQLPEQCQKVLTLSLNGLKNNEIAEDLQISINTVKSQKKRAYQKLREQLKDVYQIITLLSTI